MTGGLLMNHAMHCIREAIHFVTVPFSSKRLNSGPASDACTELLEETIRKDHYKPAYYDRILPWSEKWKEYVGMYEKSITKLYESRSASLGIDVEYTVVILNNTRPHSRFNVLCFDATSFLSLLLQLFLEPDASSEFTSEELHELQTILKDHITIDSDNNATLTDNPDFIEGVFPGQRVQEIVSYTEMLVEFDLGTVISNTGDDEFAFSTTQVIKLTKLAINLLKVKKALLNENIGSFISIGQSDISASDLNKAYKLQYILSPCYRPDAEHQRIVDIYNIFVAEEIDLPNIATCIEIYVLLNRAYKGQLRSQLTTDQVFHCYVAMLKFFDSITFKDIELAEALNLVQCLDELILTPQGRTRNALPSELIHPTGEISRGALPSPAASGQRAYEDEDVNVDEKQPLL